MGSFDKKTKTTQQAKTTTDLTDYSRSQLESGKSAIRGVISDFNTNHAYTPYTGPMVAGLSNDELRAREIANGSVGSNLGLFDDAAGRINAGANASWTPDDVAYKTYTAGDEQKFFNPYKDAVVDATGAFIDEERNKQIAANQARATLAGSYGGSRHGVADAELMRTAAMDKAGVEADLNYRGFNDAMDRDERERGALYGADTFNAGRKDEAAKYNIDNQYRAGEALSGLAADKQASVQRDIDMLSRLGATEREIEQAKLLAERAQYDDKAADEWKRFQLQLQTEMGLFGATPILTTTNSSGSSTSKTSDPIGTLSSLAGGIGGLFSGFGSLTGPPGVS